MKANALLCLGLSIFFGCSSALTSAEGDRLTDAERKAQYQLTFADSLENSRAYLGAATVYKVVVELYPNTPYYAEAVRGLAYLFMNPFNSARNDSIALYWFTKHLEIQSLPRAERSRSLIVASMLRDRMQIAAQNARKNQIIDSLSAVARIQAMELDVKTKKIADITADLEQTDNDLRILLDFQRNPTVSRRDSEGILGSDSQRIAEVDEVEQARRAAEQTNEQLRKLREIDLRALQRRAKR
jgi:hypothetical protein